MSLQAGDFVIVPFAISCGHCEFCRGSYTSCSNGGFWNDARIGTGGLQAQAARVPLADGTLVKVPGVDPIPRIRACLLLPTLSDVYGTGWHAAATAGVRAGDTVAVIGDGAVGLLAVLSAKQLGAERVVLMGRHRDRTDLGRDFGATDVVENRGKEGIAEVRDLTQGGAIRVLEAVGHPPAYEQALGVVSPGGSFLGSVFRSTAKVPSAGRCSARTPPSPADPRRSRVHRAPAAGRTGRHCSAGRVFDRTIGIEEVPAGYEAMDKREALKVMVRP